MRTDLSGWSCKFNGGYGLILDDKGHRQADASLWKVMKQLEAERDRLRTAATLALQYVEIQHDGQAVTDVVERLRAYAKDQGGWHNIDDTCEQAADEIVQLRAERDRLRDVLVLAETYSDCMGVITVEAIRAALGDTK